MADDEAMVAATESEIEQLIRTLNADDEDATAEALPLVNPARMVSTTVLKKVLGAYFFGLRKRSGTKAPARQFTAAAGNTVIYEELYGEDKYGEEALPNALVWKVYNDETQLFDLERVEVWRDSVDVLLVFIGLFAAVVSAFLIESSKTLQPDYAQISVIVSYAVLRSLNNSVALNPSLSPDLSDPRFGMAAPTMDNVVVNALWYASLTLSLSAALIAMLIKQWLHEYMATPTEITARENARIRQFRTVGLTKYRVPVVIDVLPILLHVALGLFLVGLAIYLRPLHTIIFGLVAAIAAIPYAFYLASIIIPFFNPQWPYKSRLSYYLYPVKGFLFASLRKLWWLMRLISMKGSGFFRQGVARFRSTREQDTEDNDDEDEDTDGSATSSSYYSLREAEKHTVSIRGAQLDVDCIVSLYHVSPKLNVRNIALEAFGGLPPSDADVDAINPIIDSDLYAAIKACRAADKRWDNLAGAGMERQHDCLIRALCIRPEVHTSTPYDLYMQDPYGGETNPWRIFGHWLFPWFEVQWERKCDFAALFTFASHQTFPLPIWAALIRLATRHRPQDPVITVFLLSTFYLPLNSSEVGAITFGRAMQNPSVRSIGLAYLGISDVDLEDTLPLYLSSLTSLLSEKYIPHLEKTASDYQRFSPSDSPSTSPIPYFLSSILPPIFQSLENQIDETSLGDETEMILCTILTNFFASPHIHDVSWETLASAIEMWYAPPAQSLQAITTPSTIRIVLQEVHHRDEPKGENMKWVQKIAHRLSWILYFCLDDPKPELFEAVCSSMQELDILPLDVELLGKTSTLRLFRWEPICKRVVDSTYAYNNAQSQGKWFEGWVTYLHAPERLAFLGSKVAGCDDDYLLDLCQVRPGDPSWSTVFKGLLSLFSNQVYLNTMKDEWGNLIEQPRQHLSRRLVTAKDVLVKYHPSLIELDIPQFDDQDNLISGASIVSSTTRNPLLPDSSSAVFALGVGHHESNPRPPTTPTSLLPGTLPGLPMQSSTSVVISQTHNPQSTEPYPSTMSPGSLYANSVSTELPVETTPSESILLATANPTVNVSEPLEPPLNDPGHQPHSETTGHVSVDMADQGPSTTQAGDPSPRGSLERHSLESNAERGDLDV